MVSAEQIKALAKIEDFSDRLEAASMLVTGNIVEIGGGEGVNTIRFLKVCHGTMRRVVVVDPFKQIPGADESYFKPYTAAKFYYNIETHDRRLIPYLYLFELPSQHPTVKDELERNFKPIGFMFIDGLQDKESVLSDLKLAESLNAELICVDDYDRETESSQVPAAVRAFIETTNYQFIDIGKREAYFIK